MSDRVTDEDRVRNWIRQVNLIGDVKSDLKELHKDIEGLMKERDALRSNMERLLKQIGEPGTCKGCGAAIYWVQHRNRKRAPYTASGLSHFADCPAASKFKTKGLAEKAREI